MDLTLQSVLSAGGVVGNLSYLLLIASMAMRNVFWLRTLAILSGLLGITYDAVWLHDPIGVFWESSFTLVNLVQWFWLYYEKRRNRLTPEQASLRDRVFPVVSNLDFRKLIKSSTRRTFMEGETLMHRGSTVPNLFLIERGAVAIIVEDLHVTTCGEGDFIGEIAFLQETTATATVKSTAATVCLEFDTAILRKLMSRKKDLDRGLSAALSTNLAAKLIRNNATVGAA